ncbi:MAG: hypothetical protein ACM3O7_07690 [Acidobacteriota bacterium]
MRRWRERGEGNLGCIVGVIILAIVVVLAVKIVPTRIAVAELQDFCEKEAEQAFHYNDEKIAYDVLTEAENKHLPVTKENIKVYRNQAEVFVEVHYTVKLDLIVTDYLWKVEHNVSRPLF